MTTIAVRDGVMAGDGRETFHHRVDRDDAAKLFRLKDGAIIGVAGSSLASSMLVEALNEAIKRDKGKKHTNLPAIKARKTFALLASAEAVWYFENGMWEDITKMGYYSIGSGSAYALAAMDAGASAVEAVKVACRRDAFSGGRITTMTVK